MSTPDKTSETLNLAEAMEDDASASTSLTSSSLKVEDKKGSQFSNDENANLGGVETEATTTDFLSNQLKELDISFLEKVVTKDSSSDFVVNEDWNSEDRLHRQPSPFRDSFTPRTEDADNELTYMKPQDDKNWKPEKGKVYSRVLQLQQSEPKKYTTGDFAKQSGIDKVVKPEVINIPCSKCGRKIAPGAMDRHIQFCFPK